MFQRPHFAVLVFFGIFGIDARAHKTISFIGNLPDGMHAYQTVDEWNAMST